MVAACLLGIGTTWLGILLAYDSHYWDSSSQGLPVSFFMVAIAFVALPTSGVAGVPSAVAGATAAGAGR